MWVQKMSFGELAPLLENVSGCETRPAPLYGDSMAYLLAADPSGKIHKIRKWACEDIDWLNMVRSIKYRYDVQVKE